MGDGPHSCIIAIIDDDEAVREALKNLIRSVGYIAETFTSAEAFLASGQLRDMACLIVDLRLPGMTGLELQKYLAAAHSRIPIIFITAHGDQATRERALRDGAVAFLEKPVRQEALVTAIRSALQGRGDEDVQSR